MATIWNDAIQILVIIMCWTLTLIFGHKATGNFSDVYSIARDGGRLNFDKLVSRGPQLFFKMTTPSISMI